MAQVRLIRDWTDQSGQHHPAGSVIDVEEEVAAQLRREGVASEPGGEGRVGPTGGEQGESWAGPAGGEQGESWPGPTGGEQGES